MDEGDGEADDFLAGDFVGDFGFEGLGEGGRGMDRGGMSCAGDERKREEREKNGEEGLAVFSEVRHGVLR